MTHTDDPFSGTWTLNREKSNFDPNHRPARATMRWQRTPEGYHMRAEGDTEDGKSGADEATFVLDGVEHPVPNAPEYSGIAERPDARTLRAIGRKGGEVVGEATYAVSEDGGTLTATVRGIDAQQRPFRTVVVWDRA